MSHSIDLVTVAFGFLSLGASILYFLYAHRNLRYSKSCHGCDNDLCRLYLCAARMDANVAVFFLVAGVMLLKEILL